MFDIINGAQMMSFRDRTKHYRTIRAASRKKLFYMCENKGADQMQGNGI